MRIDEITDLMREAGIPPYSLKTTLFHLKQAALRDIVMSGSFRVLKAPQSYILVSETQDAVFSEVFGRFCAELVLTGQKLKYVPYAIFKKSVEAHYTHLDARDPGADMEFLAIPDYGMRDKHDELVDAHLLTLATRGCAVILGAPLDLGVRLSTPLLAVFLDRMAITVPVRHV